MQRYTGDKWDETSRPISGIDACSGYWYNYCMQTIKDRKMKNRQLKYISAANAVNIINAQGGKFHTVLFIKKDGTLRTMNCRNGVTKYLKGGSLNYNRTDKGLLGTWDTVAKGYRSINVKAIVAVHANGMDYVVRETPQTAWKA
jgi:hypothetical protein